MWQALDRENVSSLLREALLRLALLLVYTCIHFTFSPNMQHVTDADLYAHYKRPRKDSYVPCTAMVLIIILIPLIVFTFQYNSVQENNVNSIDATQAFLAWTLALCVNALVTEVLKLAIGRPRPDFFYRCYPSGYKTSVPQRCESSLSVIDGRKSFPSGHTSFSFCSLGFLSCWLYGKQGLVDTTWKLLQITLPLLIASVIGVSRYLDNHHHWDDVLAGALIGLVISLACYQLYFHPLYSEMAGVAYAQTTSPPGSPSASYYYMDDVSARLRLMYHLNWNIDIDID